MNLNHSVVALDDFNCLRTPDAVKDLPNFDGNPRYDFIHMNSFIWFQPQIGGTTYEKIIIRAIRNKVLGPANEVLLIGRKWKQI